MITVKTIRFTGGMFYVEEYEVEAFERYMARQSVINQSLALNREVEGDIFNVHIVDSAPERVVIEPMKTWEIGGFEGERGEIMDRILGVVNQKKGRLTVEDVERARKGAGTGGLG